LIQQYSEVAPTGPSDVRASGAWEGSIDFEGIPSWKHATGLRLTLTVTSMLWSSNKDNSTRTLFGHWTLKWVQPTTTLGQPHTVVIDQGSSELPVRLSQVLMAPSATVFDLSIAGGKYRNYNSPTFGCAERVSDGKKYELLGGAEPDKIFTPPLGGPGKYVLIITLFDNEQVRWELPFTVVN
jgi:hypothetical protein